MSFLNLLLRILFSVLASGLAVTGLVYTTQLQRPSRPEKEPYLCDACNVVDFHALFVNYPRPQRRSYERYWILGVEPIVDPGATCRFCSVLRDLIKKNNIVPRVPLVKVVITRAFEGIDIPSIKIYSCIGFCESRRTGLEVPDWEVAPANSSWVIVMTATPADTMTVDGRIFREKFVPWRKTRRGIDLGLTKTWIDDCVNQHGGACRPLLVHSPRDQRKSFLLRRLLPVFNKDGDTRADIKPPKTFRLVDVDSCSIYTLPYKPSGEDMPKFAALSYVWGHGDSVKLEKENLEKWSQPGALTNVDLPRTIKDAIDCTRMLDLRYLWTDRLCIVQDDPDERTSTVRHMHGIYTNAYFTIVAASGYSCHAGLKGHSTQASWSQPESFNIRDIELTLAGFDTLKELRESEWVTRGWTFQEAVCSRRSLLLMESSAAFWCAKSIRHQDSWGVSDVPHSDWTRSLTPFSTEPTLQQEDSGREGVTEAYTRKLEDLLRGYLSRQLGCEDDYLNAFSGVLGYIGRGLGQHHHGLPKKIFGRAIAWTSDSAITTGGLERPSWSWVGWKFPRTDISFHIPHGELYITFYRADRLKQPLWGPEQQANHPLRIVHAHFTPNKNEMAAFLKQIFLRPNNHSSQYFPAGSLQKIRDTTSATIREIDILKSHWVVFFTSSATLVMLESTEGITHGGMTRWDVMSPGSKRKIASITIQRQVAEQLRPSPSSSLIYGTFIVIQGQWNKTTSSLWYRLMMIEKRNEIAFRIGLTEDLVDSFIWHNMYIHDGRACAERDLIVLG